MATRALLFMRLLSYAPGLQAQQAADLGEVNGVFDGPLHVAAYLSSCGTNNSVSRIK